MSVTKATACLQERDGIEETLDTIYFFEEPFTRANVRLTCYSYRIWPSLGTFFSFSPPFT